MSSRKGLSTLLTYAIYNIVNKMERHGKNSDHPCVFHNNVHPKNLKKIYTKFCSQLWVVGFGLYARKIAVLIESCVYSSFQHNAGKVA